MIEYPSVNGFVGVVISQGMATLYELQTIYSYDDLLDMVEVIAVNNYNQSLMME
jgi:hypothetical protein